MSSHMLEVPVGIKAGVSKVVELGRKAITIVSASPQAALIGLGFGFLAATILRWVF